MKLLLQFRHATDMFRRVPFLMMAFMLSFLMMQAPDANATHFRGGTVTWQQAGGNTVTVTVTSQWRRGFFITNGFPQNVGSVINLGTLNYEFVFGDGQIVPMNGVVVNAIDIANDISFFTWTYTKTYANPGNYNAIAFDNDCCRLSTLQNGNNDRPYELHTIINVGPPYNNPPVSGINPIINIPVNAAAATFDIPATDPDNNPLTYRLSTTAESGLLTIAPPGLSLAANGTVTFNTIGKAINQLFALQVMVEDGLTKTPVDFMIKIVGPSAPPFFTSPAAGSVYNVTPPSNSVNFTVSAQDPDAGQFVTLQPVSVPVGSSMLPALPVAGPVNGVATSDFSWTPTTAQVGTYVINYVAQDDLGIQAFRSVTINVLCALDATAVIVDNECLLNNGSITVTPVNYSALANLVYSWQGPPGFVNPGNVSSITGLAPGTYTMRIDDIATGCFIIRTYTVNTIPDNFVVNCRDLTVVLDANGQASIPANVNESQMTAITKGFLAGVCDNPAIAGPVCDCPDGYVVTGYSADIGNGWGANVISRYKLHCTELLPNGTLGANTTVTCENGSASGTSTGSASAAAGEVLVGMQIRIGCAIDRVTGYSKPIADVIAGSANNISNMMASVGGVGGSLQPTQYAPDGNVIVGMQTYTDNSIAAGVAWRYAPITEVMNMGGTAYSGCGVVTSTFSQTSFDCSDLGVNLVTYTATNVLGEVSTCTFNVTVVDNTAPTITCPANITVNNDPGICGATVSFSNMVVQYDPVGPQSSTTPVAPSFIAVGYGASSASTSGYPGWFNNNVWPVGQITNSPVIDLNQYVEFAVSSPAGTIFDYIDYQKFSYLNAGATQAAIRSSADAFTTDLDVIGVNPGGLQNLIFDVSGLGPVNGSVTFRIYFWGAPSVSDWDDLVSSAAGGTGLRVYASNIATANDNCPPPAVTYSGLPANGFFNVGTTTITATATDASGNVASCSFDVTVIDNELPVINCPADITVNNDPGVCGAVINYSVTSSDNCPGETIVQTGGIASGSAFPVGTTTNTFEVTDAAGNVATCSFDVTVVDIELPVITCPANITVGNDPGVCGAVINYIVTASDNCPGETVIQIAGIASGSVFPVGVTNNVFQVIDAVGNVAVCSFTVTVNDVEAPTIICPPDVEFCYDDAVILGNAIANDNCGLPLVTNDAPVGFAPGTTIVTWTATDAAGNTSTCTQAVTVHLLNAFTSVVDVLCYGENTGSINVTTISIPAANPADILYSLDGGATTQASNVFNNLYAGNYIITVINTATNCTTNVNAVITQPSSPVSVSVSSSTPSCFGTNTGTATALGSGGTPGYTYEWFDSTGTKVSVSDFAGSLYPGPYTVVVTDANGCTATATTVITELPEVIVDLGEDKTIFYGALGYNGCHTLTPTITGATAPLSYTWSSTNPDPAIPASSGSTLNVCVTSDIVYSYTVLVTDVNGCTGSATVNIIYANIDCSNQQNAGKVTLCNVPPGNPLNCNTICVSVSAAAAILANGGYVGPCLPNCVQPEAKTISSAPGVTDAELNLYPNPANTLVNIEYISETDNAEALLITDLQGRIIENINIAGAFEYRSVIDISNYDNGIYFVNIISNNAIWKTAKLVKSE